MTLPPDRPHAYRTRPPGLWVVVEESDVGTTGEPSAATTAVLHVFQGRATGGKEVCLVRSSGPR